MKKFIITIDTEGDNLWAWKPGDKITTENTLYIERFQRLANEYGFKPVWLTDYEMIQDPRFVNFIEKVEQDKNGEIGMHLHAWSTPPDYDLPQILNGPPYLTEYPQDIMEEKISVMTDEIYRKTGIKPVSHRAGRWAMNDVYFGLLSKYGYKVDCSVTPHVDWSIYPGQSEGSKGSNYTSYQEKPYFVANDGLIEMPVTVKETHAFILPEDKTVRAVLGSVKKAITSQKIWLRPNGKNLNQMLWLLKTVYHSDADYVMFMIHSSELMPGGSPTFKTADSIEKLYTDLEALFDYSIKLFEGCTLREYYQRFTSRKV